MTEEQFESQPGFSNDCKAWGDWMAERESHPDVLKALTALGVDAVRTVITDGMDESAVRWVSPDKLSSDALRLRERVLKGSPGTRRIIETYASHANGVESPERELAQDLSDVSELARWAAAEGASRMTLQVNW